MARTKEPDMRLKSIKKVRLVICCTQIRPREHDIGAYQVNGLISRNIRTVNTSDSLITNLGTVILSIVVFVFFFKVPQFLYLGVFDEFARHTNVHKSDIISTVLTKKSGKIPVIVLQVILYLRPVKIDESLTYTFQLMILKLIVLLRPCFWGL